MTLPALIGRNLLLMSWDTLSGNLRTVRTPPLWPLQLRLCMELSTSILNRLVSNNWAAYSKTFELPPPYDVLLTSSRNISGSTGPPSKRRKRQQDRN